MSKTLQALAALIDGAEVVGDGDIEIKDIEHDSRKIQEGALFVCMKGVHTDGHKYIPQAREKGAAAIISQGYVEKLPQGMAALIVPNLAQALQKIVPFFHDYPAQSLRVIGVTGTNGKTSITYMLRAILRRMGFRVGLIGTIQIMIEDKALPIHNTTPDVVDLQRILAMMRTENMDYVIMEVSSHALAQNRVAGIEFDTAIFTNLTQDHLDYHKTMANYMKAKTILFDLVSAPGSKDGKTAVVNIDDEAGKAMLEHAKCRQLTYSINKAADLQGENVQVHAGGTSFDIKLENGTLPLNLQVTGIFNVYNVMAAVGAALAEGVPAPVIKAAMEEFTAVPGRFELVKAGQDFSVIVDYAHTPDGLENILKTARQIAKKRIITVFGCGGDRDNIKRPIMGRIAGELSDYVIITSDNPRSEDPVKIIDMVEIGVKKSIGDKPYERPADRREAIFRAVDLAEKDDIVVIAGKGHENYQILKDKTIHFDDKEIALEAIKAKLGSVE